MRRQKHIFNSGIIGNCAYIAHVDNDSNINLLCWPSFEGSFVFGTLLDEHKGGRFSITPPSGIIHSSQYYVENTNILCTTIESAEGSYRITDYAPRFEQYEPYYKPLILICKIELISGHPKVRVECDPKYHFGKSSFQKNRGSNHIQFERGDVKMRLVTNMPTSHSSTIWPI